MESRASAHQGSESPILVNEAAMRVFPRSHVAFFFSIFVLLFAGTAIAREGILDQDNSAQEILVLGSQIELAEELSIFNLQYAKAQISCLCLLLNEIQDKTLERVCADNRVDEIRESYINMSGVRVSEKIVCRESAGKMLAQVRRTNSKYRVLLGVMQKNDDDNRRFSLQAHSALKHADRETLEQIFIQRNIEPAIEAGPRALLPLTDEEVDEGILIYERQMKSMADRFLQSVEFQMVFGQVELSRHEWREAIFNASSENLLKRLKSKIDQFNSELNREAGGQRPSLGLFFSMYSNYVVESSGEWRRKSITEIFATIDSLPLVLHLDRINIEFSDLALALNEHIHYLEIRLKKARFISKEFKQELDEAKRSGQTRVVDRYLFAMDDSLASLYLPVDIVSSLGFTQSTAADVIEMLHKKRRRQIFYGQITEVGFMLASTFICVAPTPFSRLISLAMRAALKSSCGIAVSASWNVDQFLEARTQSRMILHEVLSSPLGKNKLRKINEYFDSKRIQQQSGIFLLLDGASLLQIVRTLK